VAAGIAEIVRRIVRLAALLLLAALPGVARPAEQQSSAALNGFEDAIHHWRNVHGDKYPRYTPVQVVQIADNLLRYQRADGGWIQNQDPARILDAAEREQFAKESRKTGGSFDNRNIYTQVEYLAAAYVATGDTRYRDASLKGIEFILAHQDPNCGGWPHTVPTSQRYHPYLTVADDVTSGVLTTLRKASADIHRFGFLDASLRKRIAQAVERGDACLLRLQVRQDGKLAGWAGQYDDATLQPAQGRNFELPSIVAQESVGVVRYLMSIPDPSPAIVAAVDGAMDWFDRVEITGWKIETIDAPLEQYRYHASNKDRRLVRDPAASGLWARFYDLQDNSVVLATRESKRVASYAEIPRERRTGYEWYGHWPQPLLELEYPKWKKGLTHD
jgi:PelA/Pel-15E family pectate lyase